MADEPGSLTGQTVPDEAARQVVREQLQRRLKSGADWFFWIAGLSVVNNMIMMAGGDIRFIFGLGITDIFVAIAKEAGGGHLFALLLGIAVSGIFVFFGSRARQRKKWAFLVGMTLYALDGGIFVLIEDWLGVGVHVFALYCLYTGLSALNKLAELESFVAPGLSQPKLD